MSDIMNNNYYYSYQLRSGGGSVMKKRDLHENKVVITGAASGIGRALATELAKERCDILLADINEEGLRRTLDLVKQAGGVVSDTKGRQIKVYPDLKHKTTLLCSCTEEMHNQLLKML